MSMETLWKTLRNPGDHFFKLKKNLSPWKQNINNFRVTEDFYTVLMLSDWPVHAHKNILFLSCFEFYV